MERRVLPLLFLIVSFEVSARVLPGYFVSLNGDTVRGEIRKGKWDRNPRTIHFRNNPAGEWKVYSPIDIRAFQVANDFYESAIVSREVSPFERQYLDTSSDVKMKVDTAFLLSLVRGPKELLYLKSKGNEIDFFIRIDGNITALVFKQYASRQPDHMDRLGEQTVIMNVDRYKEQLHNYFIGCSSVHRLISKGSYEMAPLMKVFREYYACKKIVDPRGLTTFSRESRSSFSVLAGVTYATLDFDGSGTPLFEAMTATDFTPSTSPTFGLCWELYARRSGFGLTLGLTALTLKSHGTVLMSNGPEQVTWDSKYQYGYVKFPISLSYTFSQGGFGPYIFLSALPGRVALDRSRVQSTTVFSGPPVVKNESFKPLGADMGVGAGLGYKVGRFKLECAAERGGRFSPYPRLASTVIRGYVTAQYIFKTR